MRCRQLLRLWNIYDATEFEFCPSCGVHAPWINECEEEEE